MSNNSNQLFPNGPPGNSKKVGDGDPPTELIKPPSGTGSRKNSNNGSGNNSPIETKSGKSTLGFNGSTSLTRRPSTHTSETLHGVSSVSVRTANQEPQRLSYQGHAFPDTPGAGAHSSIQTRVKIKSENTKDIHCGSHSKKSQEPLTEKKDNNPVSMGGKRRKEQDQANRKKIRASPVPATLLASSTTRPSGIDTNNENIFSPTFKQNPADNNKNIAFATQATQESCGNERGTTFGNGDGSKASIATEADASRLGNKTDAELVRDYDMCVSQLQEGRKKQDSLARSIERAKRDCKTLDKEMNSLQQQKSKKMNDLANFETKNDQVNASIESNKAQMTKMKLEMKKRIAKLDGRPPQYDKPGGPGAVNMFHESERRRFRTSITDQAFSRNPADHKWLQEIVKNDLEKVFLSFDINVKYQKHCDNREHTHCLCKILEVGRVQDHDVVRKVIEEECNTSGFKPICSCFVDRLYPWSSTSMADCADASDFDSSYVAFKSDGSFELLNKFLEAIGDKLNNDKISESERCFAKSTSATVQTWHELCMNGQKERLVCELKTNLKKALDEITYFRGVDHGTSIILCNVFKVGRVQELEPVKKALDLAIRDNGVPGYDLRSCFVKRKGQSSDSYEPMSYAKSYEEFLDASVEFKTHYEDAERRRCSVKTFVAAVRKML